MAGVAWDGTTALPPPDSVGLTSGSRQRTEPGGGKGANTAGRCNPGRYLFPTPAGMRKDLGGNDFAGAGLGLSDGR
jgi:hypothetical protein